MNPTETAIIMATYTDGLTPAVVEHVSENLMYVGYCLDTTTSYESATWMIKRVMTDDKGLQTIFYAGGDKLWNKQWSERKTYKYKPTEAWEE